MRSSGSFSRSRPAVKILGGQPEPRKNSSGCLMAGPGEEGSICDLLLGARGRIFRGWVQRTLYSLGSVNSLRKRVDPTCTQNSLSLSLQRSPPPPFWQSASSKLPQKGLSPARAEHHHSTCQNSCLGAWACTTHAPASCGLTACLSLRPPFPSLLTF